VTDASEDRHPTSSTFVAPEIYYARLAAAYVTAAAVITDPDGRVLLVDPNYRDHWLLPGGAADDNEPPEAACARELKEELGLDLTVGPLLVVGWTAAYGDRLRPTVSFVFDGGTLDAYGFFAPGDAVARLGPGAHRLPAALRARTTKVPVFQSRV
jgi:8-oxo-dGTP diphosphatase